MEISFTEENYLKAIFSLNKFNCGKAASSYVFFPALVPFTELTHYELLPLIATMPPLSYVSMFLCVKKFLLRDRVVSASLSPTKA